MHYVVSKLRLIVRGIFIIDISPITNSNGHPFIRLALHLQQLLKHVLLNECLDVLNSRRLARVPFKPQQHAEKLNIYFTVDQAPREKK